MFEQAFKNIDDVLWKEAGCTTELDYTEQTSWLLFLKYLDGLEQDRADEAALGGKKYTYILDKPYRWESWAAPKGKDDKLDHNKAVTGDDLRDFVSLKLFPYLHGFKQKASGSNTIEYKIGEIFGEIKNKISSGYNLREIIDHIDELGFRSQTDKHELSHLYEAKIRNMGNAGGTAASTTLRARSSAPSCMWSSPGLVSASTTARSARRASSASRSST
jgi:type I restriction enzyme M protein